MNENNENELAARLLAWRRSQGLTQRAAAARFGAGYSTYRDWEAGTHRPAGIGLAVVEREIAREGGRSE